MHTPLPIEQRTASTCRFAPGQVFFTEGQSTRKLDGLPYSRGSVIAIIYINRNVTSIAPFPKCVVQGSLALLLWLRFCKFSPEDERYWKGARGLRGKLRLTGRKQHYSSSLSFHSSVAFLNGHLFLFQKYTLDFILQPKGKLSMKALPSWSQTCLRETQFPCHVHPARR